MSDWISGRVTAVTHWTDTLFSLQVQAELSPWVAGQFTKLALDLPMDAVGDIQRVGHAYSLVNAPGQAELEFYIVLIPHGRLSPHLHRLVPGDTVWVGSRPTGFLTAEEVPSADTLWLLSTGTALGPYLSLMEEGAIFAKFRQVVLVHGVRWGRELNYQGAIQALQQRWTGRLQYVPFVSREDWTGALAGRIPAAIVDGRLEQRVGLPLQAETSQVMLCGNPEMVRDTLAVLQARGLRKHLRRAPGHISMENYW